MRMRTPVTRTPAMFSIYTALVMHITAPVPAVHAAVVYNTTYDETAINRVVEIEQTRIPKLLNKSCEYVDNRQTIEGVVDIVDQIEDTLTMYEEGSLNADINAVLDGIDEQLSMLDDIVCDNSQ